MQWDSQKAIDASIQCLAMIGSPKPGLSLGCFNGQWIKTRITRFLGNQPPYTIVNGPQASPSPISDSWGS